MIDISLYHMVKVQQNGVCFPHGMDGVCFPVMDVLKVMRV